MILPSGNEPGLEVELVLRWVPPNGAEDPSVAYRFKMTLEVESATGHHGHFSSVSAAKRLGGGFILGEDEEVVDWSHVTEPFADSARLERRDGSRYSCQVPIVPYDLPGRG